MRILPPVWFLMCIALMILLRALVPVLIFQNDLAVYLGIALALLGMFLFLNSANLFRKVQTPIKPFTKSTTLVVTGAYRLTRNPMYVGMIAALIGIAIELEALTPFFVIPGFFLIVEFQFVQKEEKLMEEIFGEPYRAFKTKTRKWL